MLKNSLIIMRSNIIIIIVTWKFPFHSPDKFYFFSELYWGNAVVAYTKPQQRKKEEGERLRGGRDQVKFIDLRFERWHVLKYYYHIMTVINIIIIIDIEKGKGLRQIGT